MNILSFTKLPSDLLPRVSLFFWKQIFQEIWSTQGETNFTFGPIEKPLFSIPSAWARRALSVWGVFLHITLIPGLVWVESLNQGQGRTHINFDQNTWPCMDESTQIPISAFTQRFCQFQNLPVTLQIIIQRDQRDAILLQSNRGKVGLSQNLKKRQLSQVYNNRVEYDMPLIWCIFNASQFLWKAKLHILKEVSWKFLCIFTVVASPFIASSG